MQWRLRNIPFGDYDPLCACIYTSFGMMKKKISSKAPSVIGLTNEAHQPKFIFYLIKKKILHFTLKTVVCSS